MKSYYLCRFVSRVSRSLLGFTFTLAVAGGLNAAATPTDEGVPLNIDVRSSVDQRWDGYRKLGPMVHGKLYLLASVKEVQSAEKMVRPVDPGAVAVQLRRELAAHGFREITPAEKAEIVLTVSYGRGYLRNPYLEDTMIDEANPGIPTSTLTSPKQAMRQREAGYEAKLQKAQAEKLYISVTAWKYPEVKGEKPTEFWKTVMVVDNPDNRDLNLALPAMLAAGVGYFDRDIKEGEVTINTTMPTGTVKLGPLNVLEMDKKNGK